MTDYKIIFGIISAILGVVGYFPYVSDIYKGNTKPHAFTWLIWAALAGISLSAQIVEKGGAGTWLLAITGSISILIFILSLFKGVKEFVLFDWLCLSGAAIAIALWALSGKPLIAVILVVIIDIFAVLPLLRHSYLKPYEETPAMFAIYFFACIFSLLALNTVNLTTVLYIAYCVLMNAAVAILLWYRRSVIGKSENKL